MHDIDPRIDALIDAYIDSSIDDDRFASLCDWLREDAEHRQAFARKLALHSEIAEWCIERSGGALAGSLDTTEAELEVPTIQYTASDTLTKQKYVLALTYIIEHTFTHRRVAMLATAAALLLGLVLSIVLLTEPEEGDRIVEVPDPVTPIDQGPAQRPAVATLVHTYRAQWAGRVPPADGSFNVGSMQLVSGYVDLELKDGAHVIVQAPARFELIGNNRMALHVGRLVADVPTSAHGFTIDTPGGRVVDLGTRFGVEVTASQRTTAFVLDGAIELHGDNRSTQALRLQADQLAHIDARGRVDSAASPLQDEHLGFVKRWDEIQVIEAQAVRDEQQHILRGLVDDPSLWLALDFESKDKAGFIVAETAASIHHLEDFDSVLQQTPGRAAGLRAVELGVDSERPEVYPIKGQSFEAPALTIAGWFRIDAFKGNHAPLLYSKEKSSGAIHWHATRDGRLGIAIGQADNEGNLIGHANLQSEPGVLGQVDGRWVHLAVVWDQSNRKAEFFINGKAHAASPDANTRNKGFGTGFNQASVLGEMVIGYYRGGPDAVGSNTPSRNLIGGVDEVLIWRRALDRKEIVLLAQAETRPLELKADAAGDE